jgi:hypothetical protein
MGDDARGKVPEGKRDVHHSHWHHHGPEDQHDHTHPDGFSGGHAHAHLHVEASLGEFLAWLFGGEESDAEAGAETGAGAAPEGDGEIARALESEGDAPPVPNGNTKN